MTEESGHLSQLLDWRDRRTDIYEGRYLAVS